MEEFIQLVKFRLPDCTELLEPTVYFFHLLHFEGIKYLAALLFCSDQTTFVKYLQVFGDCLPGSGEVFGNSVWGHCLQRYQCDNSTPCGVCYGLEYVSPHKISNRSVANISAIKRLRKFFLQI